MSSEEYAALPLKEKIILTTGSKLVEHFRGLELAGMMSTEAATNMIGCIRKLQSIARGEEPVEKKPYGAPPRS